MTDTAMSRKRLKIVTFTGRDKDSPHFFVPSIIRFFDIESSINVNFLTNSYLFHNLEMHE